jgi:hypothetical protein
MASSPSWLSETHLAVEGILLIVVTVWWNFLDGRKKFLKAYKILNAATKDFCTVEEMQKYVNDRITENNKLLDAQMNIVKEHMNGHFLAINNKIEGLQGSLNLVVDYSERILKSKKN